MGDADVALLVSEEGSLWVKLFSFQPARKLVNVDNQNLAVGIARDAGHGKVSADGVVPRKPSL